MKRLAILMGTVVLGVPAARSAETVTCSARVPTTGCSSGNIIVELDPETGGHKTHVGAVACWGTDFNFLGLAEAQEKVYPYFEADHYLLDDVKGRPIAHFYLDKTPDASGKRVATLDMISDKTPNGPLPRTQFNLVCEKLPEPKPDPKPKPGFPDDECRPGDCPGW